MKKQIKYILAMAVITIVSVTAYNAQVNEVEVSNLTMDNVEAIAGGESGSDCPNGCLAAYGFCHCYTDYFLKEATW